MALPRTGIEKKMFFSNPVSKFPCQSSLPTSVSLLILEYRLARFSTHCLAGQALYAQPGSEPNFNQPDLCKKVSTKSESENHRLTKNLRNILILLLFFPRVNHKRKKKGYRNETKHNNEHLIKWYKLMTIYLRRRGIQVNNSKGGSNCFHFVRLIYVFMSRLQLLQRKLVSMLGVFYDYGLRIHLSKV